MAFGPCSPNDCLHLTPFRFSSPQFLQASGILKGFDPLLNLVLDGTIEYMRGECSQRGSEPPHWALLTAQARQPATCAMRTVLADQTARRASLPTVPVFLARSLDHRLGDLKGVGPPSLASRRLLGTKSVPGMVRRMPTHSGARQPRLLPSCVLTPATNGLLPPGPAPAPVCPRPQTLQQPTQAGQPGPSAHYGSSTA